MHGSTAPRSGRRLLPWLAATLLLSGLGCDSIVGGDDEPSVEGTWVTTQGTLTLYLEITDSTVTVYEGASGECYYVDAFDRLQQEGDRYTLSGQMSSSTFQVTFRLEDGRLRAQSVSADDTFNALYETTSQDLSALDQCTVLGTWVNGGEEFVEYVHITSSTLTVYGGLPDGCVSIIAFDIQEKNGGVYRLMEQGGGQLLEVTLRLDGEQLVITNAHAPNQLTYYDPSDQDVSALEECGPGPGDPRIDCYELPAIEPGDTISGELTASDGVYSGWYYDLYGLVVTTSREVQIDLSSDEIDSFVVVYREGGDFLKANDNADTSTLDASVSIYLNGGCYRVEASSAVIGETGAYTLTVN